jgi:multiple sugar transport system substrate-binding protein
VNATERDSQELNRRPNQSNELSRRDFLRGSAMLGVGLLAVQPGTLMGTEVSKKVSAKFEAPAVVSAKSQFEGTKLNMWMLSGSTVDAIQDQAPKIKEALGIDLDISVLPYQQLFEKALAGAKTGDLPDVLPSDYPWSGTWIEAGVFAPIDEFINNPDLADPSLNLQDFIPARLKSHGGWKGQQYGFPWWVAAQTMLYRTDVFAEAGIEPPATWTDWLVAAKKVTKADFWMVALPAKKSSEIIHPFRNRLYTHGGDWVSEPLKEGGKGEILINNDTAVLALDMFKEHLGYADPSSISYEYGEIENAFVTATVATSEFWNDVFALAQDPEKSMVVGKVAAAEMPAGTQRGTSLGGWFLGVSSASKNKEAAFKVIEFLTSEKPLLEQGLKFGIAGGRYSFYKDQAVLEKYPGIEVHLKALETAVARPRIPEYFQMADILQIWLSKAIAEGVPTKEALDNVAKEWEPLLAKYM